ncbi:MAG TPA: phasin superfamily protein [Geomonas sp.]|nr:phasin superfamily protein [Geomonas sp.]
MFEILEKAAMTALGAAAITQKKGEELVKEMKARYKMSEEEGRVFLERIQELAQAGRERTTEAAEIEVRAALERLGMVTREEFDKLERRVRVLEAIAPQDEEPGTEC